MISLLQIFRTCFPGISLNFVSFDEHYLDLAEVLVVKALENLLHQTLVLSVAHSALSICLAC